MKQQMCVCVCYAHICECVCPCVHMQRPEEDIGWEGSSSKALTFLFEASSVTEPEAHRFIEQLASKFPGSVCLHLLTLGLQACTALTGLYMGAGDMNSGPLTFTANGLIHSQDDF